MDLAGGRFQTDTGSEFIGSPQARPDSIGARHDSAFTQAGQAVTGLLHQTIPPSAHTWQAEVETVHRLIEEECYEVASFSSRSDFLPKATSYLLWFNTLRKNSYPPHRSPGQILQDRDPALPQRILTLPPLFLDELHNKLLELPAPGGYDLIPCPGISCGCKTRMGIMGDEMALQPGTMLGPHEILSLIGAGGMGEVYKARDTRLNRIVAIKTLPAHLAERPELRERFKREASTLANLKHAHICTLYDIGHQDGIDYLVMEYLEGETLAERLKKGALPLDQVLQYATEISDALDTAHRKGFTHRDIKPANIMLTKEGSKLLDFGLAKLKQEIVNAGVPPSERPTAPGTLTQHGTLLGTLQYMAPEQVEGKTDELDGRTDVFAFGAVVYEMATGKKAFDGKTQASVIAKILEINPPPMSTLQPMTPPALDRVVKRCLAKDREERWQTAYDLWQDLQWIKEAGQAGMPAPLTARRKLRERLGWIAAVSVLFISLVAALVPAVRYFERPPGYASPARLLVDPPPSTDSYQVLLSPDGRHVAFVAPRAGGATQLWVRSLDSLTAQPLPGTEGVFYPFWSPDSRFLGFFSSGKLRKIEVSGGLAQTLCDAPAVFPGGAWNEDGVIVLSGGNGISRVSAAGGEPVPLTTRDASRGEIGLLWPSFLPDGRHFLYTVQSARPENGGIFIGSLDSKDSKERTRLLADPSMAVYAPQGYLLFVRQGALMGRPFDANRLQFTGDAFPMVEQVAINPASGRAGFAISDNGVLAYRAGSGITESQLRWFDRAGRQLGAIGPPGAYLNPKLSPDGKRVAVEQVTTGNRDIWILEVERGIASRFTFDAAPDLDPLWSPDGKQIAFTSLREGSGGSLYQKPSSGAGSEELLLKAAIGTAAQDWSSDGRFIIYRPLEGPDVWVLPLAGDPRQAGTEARKPFPYLQSQFTKIHSQISPDRKWVAYLSNESGRYEVYIQSFPKLGAKWQISTNGGVQPRWRRDGKELFYIAPDGKLMAAPMRGESTLEIGAPQPLFEAHIVEGATTRPGSLQQYDVSPDGQRFLLNVGSEAASTMPITVVLNWTAGIKKQ